MLFTKFSEKLKHMRSKKKRFLDDLTWNGLYTGACIMISVPQRFGQV